MFASVRSIIKLSEPARACLRVLAGISGMVLLVATARIVSALLPDTLMRPDPTPLTAAERATPNWDVLQIAPAAQPGPRFSEPVSGRVVVDERHAVRVGTPLAGRVAGVFVEFGQAVDKGAPLLSIASAELATLRAELKRSEIALIQARSEDQRAQSMAAQGLVAAKEALATGAQLRRAELAQRAAASRLRALRVDAVSEHEFVVRAPSSGVVVEKHVLPSQRVDPGSSLLQLADLSRGLWIYADVFEHDVIGIEPGTEARVVLDREGHELSASVEHTSAVVDPLRRSVRVRLHARSAALRPNQYVQVRFLRTPPLGAAEVSASAVVSDGAEQSVYVLDESGHYQRRSVLVGSLLSTRALILSGLQPGERVVERGAHLLVNHLPELLVP